MSRRSTRRSDQGVSRWVTVAGAIVAIGGLMWSVVSHFIPPRVAETSSTAEPPKVREPDVHVEGTGNVGIGVMSGGQITVGSPTRQQSDTVTPQSPATP